MLPRCGGKHPVRPLRNPVAAVDASSKNRPAGGANRQQRRFLRWDVDRRCGQIGVHSKIILRSEPRTPGTVMSTSGEVVLFLDTLCSAHAICDQNTVTLETALGQSRCRSPSLSRAIRSLTGRKAILIGKLTGPVRSPRSSQQDNCAANLESCRPAVKWFYF